MEILLLTTASQLHAVIQWLDNPGEEGAKGEFVYDMTEIHN